MIVPEVWEHLWVRIESAFQDVGRKVQSSVDSKWTCGHHSNDVFPFRAYATFSYGGKSVDLSVDCTLADRALVISADLARENGEVLADSPHFELPLELDDTPPTAEFERAIRSVVEFLTSQVNAISEALS